jgi:amino acid adenylation domain-containing protein
VTETLNGCDVVTSFPTALDLPTDRPRRAGTDARTERVEIALPVEDPGTALAGFVALLHRYTGATDLLVATERLPLRFRLTGDTTFTELLAPVEVDEGPCQVGFGTGGELSLTVNGNAGLLDYRTELFDAETIRRFGAQLRALLADAIVAPNRRVDELAVLPADERARILTAWNDTAGRVPGAGWLTERIAAHAFARPDAPAVIDANGTLCRGDLVRRAGALSAELRSRGVGRGDVVALFLDRGADLVVAMLAVLWSGAAYLPLDTALPEDRIRFLLKDSGAVAVIGDGHIPVHDTGAGDCTPPAPVQPDDLAYVIYTSGSTGVPKGVAVTHRGLANLVSWHLDEYALTEIDRTTQLAATGFDASVWENWTALAAGATLCVPADEDRLRPDALLDWLARMRITVSFLPTPLAEEVITLPAPEGLALRALLTGGDALSATPAPGASYTLINHYGPTEASVVVTAGAVRPGSAGVPDIGAPIANTRVYVLDANLRPVPIGVPGDLYVAGAGLARGYLGRPGLTAAAFVPDPFEPGGRLYRTGDRVRWRAGGVLEFLGRVDQQVKIRGFRIELGEIEAAARTHPGVAEVVVIGRADRLIGYVTGTAEPGALTETLRRRLPEYAVPSAIVVLEKLPITANGKIDRAALPEPPRAAPRTSDDPIEREVATIWGSLLGVDEPGPDDDFFALGGHSLLATQVVARVSQAFGVEVPVGLLFTASTVTEFAAALVAQLHQMVEELSDDEVQRLLADSQNEGGVAR